MLAALPAGLRFSADGTLLAAAFPWPTQGCASLFRVNDAFPVRDIVTAVAERGSEDPVDVEVYPGGWVVAFAGSHTVKYVPELPGSPPSPEALSCVACSPQSPSHHTSFFPPLPVLLLAGSTDVAQLCNSPGALLANATAALVAGQQLLENGDHSGPGAGPDIIPQVAPIVWSHTRGGLHLAPLG